MHRRQTIHRLNFARQMITNDIRRFEHLAEKLERLSLAADGHLPHACWSIELAVGWKRAQLPFLLNT